MIDASALAEVLLRTPTGDALARRVATEHLVAPGLIDVEVASVLRRYWNTGVLDDSEVADILAALVRWPIERVPEQDVVGLSRRWWPNATAYDALYLAVAAAYGVGVLTCDGPLGRAPSLGVPIENFRV